MPLDLMKALATVAPREWSAKKLRRLGECLRDDLTPPPGHPPYEDVMVWYDDLAAAVNADIRALDWESLLVGRQPPEITSRAKTIDTLKDKLRRDRSTPLSSIQDVAGVRFEVEMTLDEQDIVAAAIAHAFGCTDDAIHDLRDGTHSGYRAVHVWLRLPHGRVEVQVRTHLQGEWANTYEALADWLGRDIRYGALPDDPALAATVTDLQELSTGRGVALEELRRDLSQVKRALRLSQNRTEMALERSPTLPDGPDARKERRRIKELRREMARGRAEVQQVEARLRAVEGTYTRELRELQTAFLSRQCGGEGTWPAS